MNVKQQVFQLGNFKYHVISNKTTKSSSGQSFNVCKYGNMYVNYQVSHDGEFKYDVILKEYQVWRSLIEEE